jgi:hypothetical protein
MADPIKVYEIKNEGSVLNVKELLQTVPGKRTAAVATVVPLTEPQLKNVPLAVEGMCFGNVVNWLKHCLVDKKPINTPHGSQTVHVDQSQFKVESYMKAFLEDKAIDQAKLEGFDKVLKLHKLYCTRGWSNGYIPVEIGDLMAGSFAQAYFHMTVKFKNIGDHSMGLYFENYSRCYLFEPASALWQFERRDELSNWMTKNLHFWQATEDKLWANITM